MIQRHTEGLTKFVVACAKEQQNYNRIIDLAQIERVAAGVYDEKVKGKIERLRQVESLLRGEISF